MGVLPEEEREKRRKTAEEVKSDQRYGLEKFIVASALSIIPPPIFVGVMY